MQIGTEVYSADGTHGTLNALVITDGTAWVYNLTVDEAHTYFVGDGQWLVHNCGGPDGDGKHSIRYAPDGTTYDVAFGVGEHLPNFANSFENPTLYYREWSNSLIRKPEIGLDNLPIRPNQILNLDDPDVMKIYLGLIMDRIRDGDFIGRIPAIRFNLQGLTRPNTNSVTMMELTYILNDPKLRSMTSFYIGSTPVSEGQLADTIKKLKIEIKD